MLVQLWQAISFGHALARVDTGNISLIGGDGLVHSPEGDLHVWVFGLDLPGIPANAWVFVKQSLHTGTDLFKSQSAVPPAARELWRFVVSTILHAIWVERLRRMEDPSLSQDVHPARSRTIFRRSVRSFRGST